MAIDCLVLPLWRLYAGEYTTDLDRLAGGRVKVIELDAGGGVSIRSRAQRSSWLRRLRGRWQARRLIRDASRAAGRKLRWKDEGDVKYSCQFLADNVVQAFAAWFPIRTEVPPLAADRPWNKELVETVKARGHQYRHLDGLGFMDTFVFPVDLEAPLRIRPEEHFWGTTHTRIYSGRRALSDLLRLQDDFEGVRQEIDETVCDLLAGGLDILHEALTLVESEQLPAAFW